jgi:lambda repressor-like predicted transcriptional regulator
MRTTLFEWAQKHGLSMRALSRRTGYSERHLYRVRDEPEQYLNQAFADRIVGRLGEWARSLFLTEASQQKGQNESVVSQSRDQEAAA